MYIYSPVLALRNYVLLGMDNYRFSNVPEDDQTLKNSQAASLNGSAVGGNSLLNLVKLLDDGCGSGLDAVKATHQQLVRLLGSQMTWAVTSVILFITKTITSITTKSLSLTLCLCTYKFTSHKQTCETLNFSSRCVNQGVQK